MFKKTVAGATLGATTLLWASPASAQDLDSAPQAVVDNLWLVIAGALVFLMQAGFAFVEAGLTRAKNLANIMAKNLADMAIGVTMFFVVGYTIAYGSGGSDWLGGFGDLFFQESADPEVLFDLGAGLTPATNFFFQVVFAATAVTIASGAMAERTKFTTYLVFAAVMTAIIYPVVVHWTWGGGLIAQMSIGDAVYSDFAGSTIVHLTGGVAALVGAYLIGPRIGKYGEDGKPRAIPGHNVGYAVIGVFILWFGWFGFNAGSELAADEFVPFLAMNTLIAAAAGVIGATAIIWLKTGVADVAMAGNGALAGLVSITAPVGTVTPVFALVIGLVGGVIVVFSVLAFDKIKIDDPVGAISVHGTCGIWGTLSIGLFAKYDDAFLGREDAGLIYGGGFDQLAMQFVMVVIVIAWVGITSFILFGALKATLGLRVSEEEEVTGLDVAEHGSSGYGLEAVGGG
ncbi:MAG TPA: ammonium transporter [Acidimicrobiaceae bacterium]|nr:ammonium transporter [Acidimicrobiaceae bacterium]|tara:strand:- start:184 stop:1554 length:1371 start_codon:yes stop_codon:yes gene_type:complete